MQIDRRRTVRGDSQKIFLTTLGIKKPGQVTKSALILLMATAVIGLQILELWCVRSYAETNLPLPDYNDPHWGSRHATRCQ
jgi:hypothetical protein